MPAFAGRRRFSLVSPSASIRTLSQPPNTPNPGYVQEEFVGTRIRYNGGDVELTKVKFVNRTLELPPNDRGSRIADYAALLAPPV